MSQPVITIRPLAPSDAEELYRMVLAQGPDLDAFAWRSRIDSPQAEAAFIEWSRDAESRRDAFSRAILVDGKLAGCASLYRPHPAAFPEGRSPTMQLGYWVDRAARGLGASWRATALLMQEASALLPQGASAGIRTREGNAASLACGAKLGLRAAAQGLASQFKEGEFDAVLIGPLDGAASSRVLGRPAMSGASDFTFPKLPMRRLKEWIQGPGLERADRFENIKRRYRELWVQGLALALPVQFHLKSMRGEVIILADGALDLWDRPDCPHFLPRDLAIESMVQAARDQDQPEDDDERGRLDQLRGIRMDNQARSSAVAAARLATVLCPDWVGSSPVGHGVEDADGREPWREGTSCLRIHLEAFDPALRVAKGEAVDPAREAEHAEAIDRLYERRAAQAAELVRALGPSAAHVSCASGTRPAREELWKRFMAQRRSLVESMALASAAPHGSPAKAPRI